MHTHNGYGLTEVINASGSYTPLGVSRSSVGVAASVAGALQQFFIMEELQSAASKRIAALTGAEAATVVHWHQLRLRCRRQR